MIKRCSLRDCNNPAEVIDLCSKHYREFLFWKKGIKFPSHDRPNDWALLTAFSFEREKRRKEGKLRRG